MLGMVRKDVSPVNVGGWTVGSRLRGWQDDTPVSALREPGPGGLKPSFVAQTLSGQRREMGYFSR